MLRYMPLLAFGAAVAGFLTQPLAPKSPRTVRRASDAGVETLYAAPCPERGVEPLYAAPRAERRSERKTTLEGDSRVVTLEKEDPFSSPQLKLEKSTGMEDMLRELREIQGSANRTYCILGTRHCSYLHQQIIELLSYALVLSGNHVYTSGAAGTNAARPPFFAAGAGAFAAGLAAAAASAARSAADRGSRIILAVEFPNAPAMWSRTATNGSSVGSSSDSARGVMTGSRLFLIQ